MLKRIVLAILIVVGIGLFWWGLSILVPASEQFWHDKTITPTNMPEKFWSSQIPTGVVLCILGGGLSIFAVSKIG